MTTPDDMKAKAAEALKAVKPAAKATPKLPAGAAAAKPKPVLGITSTDDTNFWGTFRMNILAPPGKGKTHLLFTASAKYPEQWPPPVPVTLDDIIIVETDSGGLSPAMEAGVTVPRIIDLSGYTDDEIFAVLRDIPKLILNEAARAPTRMVAIDTMSTFMDAICASKMRGVDGPKLYAELAGIVRRFSWDLRGLHCPLVFTCHIKEPAVVMRDRSGAPMGADVVGQQVATGLAPGELTMELPGRQAARALRDHGTFTAYLRVTDIGSGRSKRDLVLEDPKVETKKRLSLAVNDIEEPHLGKFFQKIAERVGRPLE